MKPTSLQLFLAGCAFGLATLTASAATSPADVAALREKAEQGNAIAQYNLGLVYADVREPAHDYAEAYVWLQLAAQSGATNRALGTILELMTPAERAEGERRLEARTPAAPATAAPVITALPLDDRADTLVGQIAALEADKRQLSDELARAWQENENLRAQNRGQGDQRQRLAIAESALATKDREIAELRERLGAAADTALAAALAEAREQTITLRQGLAALEAERDALAHQSDQFSAQLSRQAVDLAEVRRTTEAAEATGRRLITLEDELQRARAELARAQADQTAQQNAARRDREELAATRASLETQAADRQRLQTQLDTRPTETELAALAAELNARDESLAGLQAELRDLQTQLNARPAADPQVAALRTELDAARATMARQEENLQRSARALSENEQSAQTLQNRVAALQAQLESRPGEAAAVVALREELAGVRTNLTAAQAEAERHRATAQEGTQRLRALQDQTAADLSTRRDLESDRDRLRAALAAAEDRLAAVPSVAGSPADHDRALAGQLETSLRAFAVQEASLSEARRDVATLREQLARRDAALSETRLALDAARVALGELQPSLQAAESRADGAGAEAAATRAEIATLRYQLADLRAELAARDDRLTDQASRLGRVDDDAARAASENARLREELRFAQAQSAEFAQRVEELRTRMATLAPTTSLGRAAPMRPGAVPTRPTPEPPPAVGLPSPTPTPVAAAPAPATASGRVHTVLPGETLSTIARDYYGSASRWAEIFEANRDRVPEPNRLGAGTLLRIP